MAGNTFGKLFTLTTFGESHGIAIGGIIDGCPAGLDIHLPDIQAELDRRKPGQSHIVSQRKESDIVELLSGIFQGKSTGAPIGFIIRNEEHRSSDYDHLKDVFRPSHADFTYDAKYGIRDHQGGGRSSARETACRVVAGAIAKSILKKYGIAIKAFVKQVGDVKLQHEYGDLDLNTIDSNLVRCPDENTAAEMIALIEEVRKAGDTIGGIVQCVITGCPPGLGEPVFDKFPALLGGAMLSINAVKGVEFGEGFQGITSRGSAFNDQFVADEERIRTATNRGGGTLGGISNGEDIYFNIAFKPVATIMQKQHTVNSHGESVEMAGKGRHDPCVLPRAVPIVEAMAALVSCDLLFQNKLARL